MSEEEQFVRHLQLSANLSQVEIRSLLTSPNLSQLETLTIDDALCTPETIEAIASATQLEHLVSLSFRGYLDGNLSGRGIEMLADIPQLRSLKSLDLREMGLGPRDMLTLARSPHLTGLERLYLGDGLYSADKIEALGIAALASSPSFAQLRFLHLDFNDIGDSGMKAIARSSQLRQLSHLDLVSNGIGIKGIKELARSRNAESLEVLDLGGNPIGDHGVYYLARSEHLKALQCLSLSGTSLTAKGMRYLASAPWLAGLKELRLSANDLGVKGMREVLDTPFFHQIGLLRFNQSQLEDAESFKEMVEGFGVRLSIEMLVLPSMHAVPPE